MRHVKQSHQLWISPVCHLLSSLAILYLVIAQLQRTHWENNFTAVLGLTPTQIHCCQDATSNDYIKTCVCKPNPTTTLTYLASDGNIKILHGTFMTPRALLDMILTLTHILRTSFNCFHSFSRHKLLRWTEVNQFDIPTVFANAHDVFWLFGYKRKQYSIFEIHMKLKITVE